MIKQYQIGNEEPFKVTPTNGKRLVEALTLTEAKVIYIGVDQSLPYLHIGVRIEIQELHKDKFELLLGRCLESVPDQSAGFTYK